MLRELWDNVDTLRFLAFVILLILLLWGLMVFYSASFHLSLRLFESPHVFFHRQLRWILVGLVLFTLSFFVRLRALRELLPFLVFATSVLMLLPHVPGVGRSLQGANRWLILGSLSFQPSEMVKIVLLLYLAHYFSKEDSAMRPDQFRYWIAPSLVVLFFSLLILSQNDYSTMLFVFFWTTLLFFMAGIPWRLILFFSIFLVPFIFFALFTQSYRLARVMAFLYPEADATGLGYQVLMSRQALINGGFWGLGFGQSIQKMGILPEAHADFVFAILAEELGFLGVLGVFSLFTSFLLIAYRLAFLQKDRFSSFIIFGVALLLVWQAFFNIAVVSSFFPPTGIPLPFFSSGGSSLVMVMVACGFLLNASRAFPQKSPLNFKDGVV